MGGEDAHCMNEELRAQLVIVAQLLVADVAFAKCLPGRDLMDKVREMAKVLPSMLLASKAPRDRKGESCGRNAPDASPRKRQRCDLLEEHSPPSSPSSSSSDSTSSSLDASKGSALHDISQRGKCEHVLPCTSAAEHQTGAEKPE